MPKEKAHIGIYVDTELKEEIEELFLDFRLKNFQEGYRNILILGLQEFKKKKTKRGEKHGI
jgi:hypothetical protein